MKKRAESRGYNHDHIPQLKEKALRTSIKEGTAANISSTIGDNSIIPFAVALNSSPMQISFLSGVSGFLYQLSQFFGAKVMERASRRKIVVSFVLLQALMWLFISVTALLVWKGVFDGYSAWMLIIFYSLLLLFGGIAYPAWFSWMGDLVNPEKKGAYFSRRNVITQSFGLAALIAVPFFLDYYKTHGVVLFAFAILFALAFAFRFISYLLFHKQYAPAYTQRKKDYFSVWSFIRKYDNFGKFAVYHGFFNLAVMVASPFFTVYMLTELGLSYKIVYATIISWYVFYLLALPLSGKFSDRYGNKKLMIITNVFFALTPVMYLLSKNPLWLITAPQITAGIASAASVISFSNFIYDAVSPRHRGICVTYTNLLIGIGTLFGAFIGGAIVNYFHPASLSPYLFLFAVAAILRISVALFFLPQIKEVRKVKRLPSRYTFFFHPIHFMHHEGAKLAHVPEKVLGKFKSLKLFSG
jgi:MFS family permease